MSETDPRSRLILLHTEQHRQVVHDFRSRAEAWLHSRGVDQFQPDSPTQASQAHDIINRLFDRGDFVGLKVDGRLVAVGALTDPDPDFWSPEEIAEPQVYVGRFLVAEHGHGHGEQLLARIAADAAQQDVPVMGLDCWRTAPDSTTTTGASVPPPPHRSRRRARIRNPLRARPPSAQPPDRGTAPGCTCRLSHRALTNSALLGQEPRCARLAARVLASLQAAPPGLGTSPFCLAGRGSEGYSMAAVELVAVVDGRVPGELAHRHRELIEEPALAQDHREGWPPVVDEANLSPPLDELLVSAARCQKPYLKIGEADLHCRSADPQVQHSVRSLGVDTRGMS